MITVVTGAPCSGKSTYVAENAAVGDVVVDMDVLALALTVGVDAFCYSEKVRKVARAARLAAVKEALVLAQGERRWGVWIIDTDPPSSLRASYRGMGARFVELNPGRDECLRRLESRPVSVQARAREVIDEWFAKR